MIKFNRCKLTPNLLDQWVQTNVNVLLIGEKGVGKTHHILDTFKRNNLKSAYFSGATLDPWIHLLGIPKATITTDGKQKMQFILPEQLDDDVEAIFCDEWNRTHKVVRNALLELQQFKSINGRKFPKLRFVWGAVNPSNDENDDNSSNYDVEDLDPAQLDRFHVIVELPNEPDRKYFTQKFGKYRGDVLVDWWGNQSKESLKILSPRRLDYVGECFERGLDVTYLLPVSANSNDLIKKLSIDEEVVKINNMLKSPNDTSMKQFLSDDKHFLKFKKEVTDEKYFRYWKYANKEFITQEIKNNDSFQTYVIYEIFNKNQFYIDIFEEIAKTDSSDLIVQIVKELHEQGYSPEKVNPHPRKINIPAFPIWDSAIESRQSSFNKFKMLCSQNGITHSAISQYYDPSLIGNVQTYIRKMLFSELKSSWIYMDDPYLIINFMMSCASSFQKATLTSIKDFIPVFGTICILAKKTLDSRQLDLFIKDIQRCGAKISQNRIDDYISYLKEESNTESYINYPSSFKYKIEQIRTCLTDIPF